MRRGGSESNLVSDGGEGGVGLDFTKGRLAIDSLQQKILKVSVCVRGRKREQEHGPSCVLVSVLTC